MKFTFDYKPESKQRPRFGANGKVYDPQRNISLAYKWEASRQMRSQSSEVPLKEPVCVNMRFHMPMPNSWSKKRKEMSFGKPMASKPDIDNLEKFVFDVLSGIAYVDDKQITSTHCEKVWDYFGKVDISVNNCEMTLFQEIEILAKAAVQAHEALDSIYQWTLSLEKIYPREKQIIAIARHVQEACLKGGLDEIYGADKC